MNNHAIFKKYPLELISIGIIWLFQVSGAIGISIGFEDWFVTKTPLNLSVLLTFLFLIFPFDSGKKFFLFGLFFVLGFLAEWIGVTYGFLFGPYEYGLNLGFKVGGVPLFIGFNWSMLVLVTGVVSSRLSNNPWVKASVGALLMVLLDFFMEISAPVFDFWTFEGGVAPVRNYIMWFVIAFILHIIFQQSGISGRYRFSLHVYLSQLLFFIYFYVLFNL